jgi:hypothetical protein
MAYEMEIKAKIDKIIKNNLVNKEIVTVLDFNNNGKYKILPDQQNLEIDTNSFSNEMYKNYKKFKKIIEDIVDYEIEDIKFKEECLKLNFMPNEELINKIYFCLFSDIKKKKKRENNNTYWYLLLLILLGVGIYYYYVNFYQNKLA